MKQLQGDLRFANKSQFTHATQDRTMEHKLIEPVRIRLHTGDGLREIIQDMMQL